MSLFEDPNDKCEKFYDLFMEVINNHAPLKKKIVKTNQQAKWFTNDLNILMKHRDYLLKKARHKPKDSLEWQDFRQSRNRIRREMQRGNFFMMHLIITGPTQRIYGNTLNS